MKENTSFAMQKSLEGEAHIWIAYTEEHDIPEFWEQYEGLISKDEIDRYSRFHFKRHSRSFLLNHALLRTTLSRYSDISPEKWIFSHTSYGRPEIQPQGPSPPLLQFNTSRTEHATVCVITSSIDCGIDIESPANLNDLALLSIKVLSPKELESFRSLAADSLQGSFLTYWTLKESYVKALGIGLSIPLPNISFILESGRNSELTVHLETSSRPSDWQFTTIKLPNEHFMSVALRKGKRPDLILKINVVDAGLTSYSPLGASQLQKADQS